MAIGVDHVIPVLAHPTIVALGGNKGQRARCRLVETQNDRQSCVYTPLLFRRKPTDEITESAGVHGANLLDQYLGS